MDEKAVQLDILDNLYKAPFRKNALYSKKSALYGC